MKNDKNDNKNSLISRNMRKTLVKIEAGQWRFMFFLRNKRFSTRKFGTIHHLARVKSASSSVKSSEKLGNWYTLNGLKRLLIGRQ
jgi:hypothetical protein